MDCPSTMAKALKLVSELLSVAGRDRTGRVSAKVERRWGTDGTLRGPRDARVWARTDRFDKGENNGKAIPKKTLQLSRPEVALCRRFLWTKNQGACPD